MGKFYERIEQAHRDFAKAQRMYFVATAPLTNDGRVNLSPKGMDSFRILSNNEVAYMDVISSGNETSAHTLENGRMTIMFCSFDKVPRILRFYGKGRAVTPQSNAWNRYSSQFSILPSTRQIFVLDVDMVQTSCGYGVPFYEYIGERTIHTDWANKLGPDGLVDYQKKKNAISIDGLVTDLGREEQ